MFLAPWIQATVSLIWRNNVVVLIACPRHSDPAVTIITDELLLDIHRSANFKGYTALLGSFRGRLIISGRIRGC